MRCGATILIMKGKCNDHQLFDFNGVPGYLGAPYVVLWQHHHPLQEFGDSMNKIESVCIICNYIMIVSHIYFINVEDSIDWSHYTGRSSSKHLLQL